MNLRIRRRCRYAAPSGVVFRLPVFTLRPEEREVSTPSATDLREIDAISAFPGSGRWEMKLP
jgi:hypothetical protein